MVANAFRSSSRPPTRIPRYHPQRQQRQPKQQESERPTTTTTTTTTTKSATTANSSKQYVSSFFQKHTGKSTPSPLTLTKKSSTPSRKHSSTNRQSASPPKEDRRTPEERCSTHQQPRQEPRKYDRKRAVLESFKFPPPPPPPPRAVPSPLVVETVNSHSTEDDQQQQQSQKQSQQRRLQGQQRQRQSHDEQQTKKETILTKRRKFETLMAGMLAKQRNSVSKQRKRNNHSRSRSRSRSHDRHKHGNSTDADRKSHHKHKHRHHNDRRTVNRHHNNHHHRYPEEQIIFRNQTATNSPTARRSYSAEDRQHPPCQIFTTTDNHNHSNSTAIRRTESHPQHSPTAYHQYDHNNNDNDNATFNTDESPFHRLMGSDMLNDNGGASLSRSNIKINNNDNVEKLVMSPYTSFQQNILGLLGTEIPLELLVSPDPLPKYRRGAAQESTYESLEGLRQKAKYNLEILDHSSRRADSRTTAATPPPRRETVIAAKPRGKEEDESYDFDLTQEDSLEEDSVLEERGRQQIVITKTQSQNKSKSKQNYILGSCSSLIEEAKKQKEQREPSERMRMTPVPPSQQQRREPSERLQSTSVQDRQEEERTQPPRDPSERQRSWPVPIVQEQKIANNRQHRVSAAQKDPSERQQRSSTVASIVSEQQRQISITQGPTQQRQREPSERQGRETHKHRAAAAAAFASIGNKNEPDLRWEEPPGSSPAPLAESLAPTLASHASELASMAMSLYHQVPIVQVNRTLNVTESITTMSEVNSENSMLETGDADDDDDTSDIQVIRSLSWVDSKKGDPAADVVTDVVGSNVGNKKGTPTKGRVTPHPHHQGKYQGGRGEGSRTSHGTSNEKSRSCTPVSNGEGLDASSGGHSARNITSTPMMKQSGDRDSRGQDASVGQITNNPGGANLGTSHVQAQNVTVRARDPSGHDRKISDDREVRDERMVLDPQGRDPKGPDPPQAASTPTLSEGGESPAESTGPVARKEDAPERKYSYKIREIKDSEDDHTIICLVDSELQDEVSGNESRSQGAVTALMNTIRKNVDQRLSRLKSKADDSSTQNQGSQKKLSTFVEDLKQGKNIKESLRHLRQAAKKKLKEEKKMKTTSERADEEIIFVDDSETTISVVDKKEERSKVEPKEKPPSTPKKRTFRASAMSPITLDAMLTEDDSLESSYTSAPSDLMAAPSVRSNFVAAEIHCYDDGSDLVGSFAGLSLEKTEKGSRKMYGEGRHKKDSDINKGLPSPFSKRRGSMSAQQKVEDTNTAGRNEVPSILPPKILAPMPDPVGNESYICLPSQISALLQSVGNQLAPSVPAQLLSISNPSTIPKEPKWAIQKEHDLAEEVMAITESMAQQLGSAFVVSEKVAERQLRAIEDTMKSVEEEASQNIKMQTGVIAEKQIRRSPSCFSREDRDFVYGELRQQLSDISEAMGHVSGVFEAGKDICPSYCTPKPATIVSSSPIISSFLKRKDQSLPEPAATTQRQVDTSRPSAQSLSHSANSKVRSYTLERYTIEREQSGQTGSEVERQSSKYASSSDEPRVVSHHVSSGQPERTSEMPPKEALFGRMVSPLTLPTSVEQKSGAAVSNTLTNAEEKTGQKSTVPSNGRGPEFPALRVDRSMLDEATSTGKASSDEKHHSYGESRSSASSQGLSSISTKRVVTDGVSSLGDSSQTDSSSFMTSFEVKETLIHSMSSVSESADSSESLGSQEPTPSHSDPSSSSPPPQSETIGKLDPPSCREPVPHLEPQVISLPENDVLVYRPGPSVAPSTMAGQTSKSETGAVDDDMSYSVDSPVDGSSTSSYYFNEKVLPPRPATPVPPKRRTAATNGGGNPLKKLLYRPRVPRWKHRRNDNPSSSSDNDSRPPKIQTVDSTDVSSQNSHGYPPASRRPLRTEPPPRRPDSHRQHDLLDEDLTRLASCISVGCGGDPPGMMKNAGNSLGMGPPLKSNSFNSTGNSGVDNLVLASWGIQNRMDQLRQSLTFSPASSFAPKLNQHKTPSIRRSASDVAASLMEKYQSKQNQNAYSVDEDDDDDVIMISSVSGRSATTSSFDELAGSSQDDSHMMKLDNAHTMETDRAFIRGWSKRAETPETLKAFASKSWKLDEEGGSENSLVESESGAKAAGEESKSGDRSKSSNLNSYN